MALLVRHRERPILSRTGRRRSAEMARQGLLDRGRFTLVDDGLDEGILAVEAGTVGVRLALVRA